MCQVIFIRIGYEDEFIIVVARFSRPGQETPAPTRDIKKRNKNEL